MEAEESKRKRGERRRDWRKEAERPSSPDSPSVVDSFSAIPLPALIDKP